MKPDQAVMATTQAVERRWFDLREAANYASVKIRCIRELIWNGKLAYAQVGKRFIVDRADLDALLEQRKHFEPSESGQKQSNTTNRQ